MTSSATPRVIYAEYRELRAIPFLTPNGFWYVWLSTDLIADIIADARSQGISVEDWLNQTIKEKLNKH